MGAIINASIDIKALPNHKFQTEKNGKIYYDFTIIINDETRFKNNVWITDNQTQEEREAKVPRKTLGNGSVVWIDNGKGQKSDKEGIIQLAVKDEAPITAETHTVKKNDDGLPF
jgi:hypothetical protein|tara:strand:- start:342 stop:683 length:342 start_codon:yes stop_codon:yes gene_type:complete